MRIYFPLVNPDTCGDQLWIGDMICDDANNNLHCHFDGGDCCLGETTLTDYCVECVCKDGKYKTLFFRNPKIIAFLCSEWNSLH